MGETHTHVERPSGPARMAVGLLLALLALIPAWVLILSGDVNGRGAYDQLNYHEPAIVRFAQQWPRMEVGNYLSATTPGYHIALATVSQVIGTDRIGLQLVGSLFSGALLLVLGLALARRVGARRAIGLGLPLVGSMYVFFPAVWLLPDNAGWLGVVAVLLLALSGRIDVWFHVSIGVALLLLVLTRQIHVWVAGVAIAAAWLGSAGENSEAPCWDIAGFSGRGVGASVTRAAIVAGAMVPSVLALGWFVRMWGGLTPPQFHGAHQGVNPAAAAFILAMFGLMGAFFVPLAWRGLSRSLASNRVQLLGGAVFGLLASVAVPTGYSVEAGRYSGLWNLTKQIPTVGERSLLIIGLATLGGGLVMWFLGSLGRRERWVFGAAIAGYIAAMTASHEVWHRYVEPHALIVLAMMAACIIDREESATGEIGPGTLGGGRRSLPGLLVLSVLGIGLAAMTSITIARAKPVRDLRLYTLPEFRVEGWSMPPGVLPAERAVGR